MLKHEETREYARVGSRLPFSSEATTWARFAHGALLGCLLLVHGGCSTPAARDASRLPVAGDSAAAAEPVALEEPARASSADAPSVPALLVSAEPEPEPDYLSPSRVAAAVRAHQAEFLACQALADLETRRGPGFVTVGWLVEPSGGVASVQLGRSSFDSARVNQCVLAVAKGVSFPRSPVRTQVSWTVKFQGSASGPLAEAAAPL